MEHTKTAEQEHRMQVMLRSHVERCLHDIWGTYDLVLDVDEDYPYRTGTAMCWVSLLDGPPLGVRVFAHAAYGLKPSAKLIREVNDLNARNRWARIAFQHGVYRVSTELHWAAVDRLALEQATRVVGEFANVIGPLLAAVFGGHPNFPPEVEQQDQNSDEEAA
jgi:predicted heme/steroid binding protein